MAESILSKEQRAKVESHFDALLLLAESPPPKEDNYRNADGTLNAEAFANAAGAHSSNPLYDKIKEIQDKVAGSKSSQEDQDALYKYHITALKKHYMKGADAGIPDENAADKQRGVLAAIMNSDWKEAIKQFFYSLPIVGELMNAVLKYGNAMVNGDKITWAQARERTTLERALKGAAGNIGVEGQTLYEDGVSYTEKPAEYAKIIEKAKGTKEETDKAAAAEAAKKAADDAKKAEEDAKKAEADAAKAAKEAEGKTDPKTMAAFEKVLNKWVNFEVYTSDEASSLQNLQRLVDNNLNVTGVSQDPALAARLNVAHEALIKDVKKSLLDVARANPADPYKAIDEKLTEMSTAPGAKTDYFKDATFRKQVIDSLKEEVDKTLKSEPGANKTTATQPRYDVNQPNAAELSYNHLNNGLVSAPMRNVKTGIGAKLPGGFTV